ncbi:GTPase-activating protein IML1 [Aspergillus stella-maris]|uniref:GTPase-activating protein IML1 n=1 Tax=Aspergillus stella-maris TaxID=1810926 RepID=UPI003CCCCEC5
MSMRAPTRPPSHLRQVSAVSVGTVSTARSVETSRSHNDSSHHSTNSSQRHYQDQGHGQGQEHGSQGQGHEPLSEDPDHPSSSDGRSLGFLVTGLDRRQCSLWVHDEMFSKDEILFNQAAFSDTGVRDGDVIEILPARAMGEGYGYGYGSGGGSVKGESMRSRSMRDRHGHGETETGSSPRSHAMAKFRTPLQTRCLFVAKPLPQEISGRQPKLEISVTSSVANIFGFKNRSTVYISIVERAQCAASHVDVAFRDQFLVRSDMWRLVMSELAGRIIYKGQKIVFMGHIKATVKNIFIRGKKVLSGFFSPQTIPVFRSEAAKYVLFIQMSREMWDFDSEGTGDILFSRVINGFLPELFKRWANADARHLVTIVLFTRVEYDASITGLSSSLNSENLRNAAGPNHVPTRDFYRVVVNDMASGHWTTILDELKKDFRTFLRDVSILKTPEDPVTGTSSTNATIGGRPSTALRGNILEAVHLASSHLSFDHIDRDMVHTGTSIIVITPGSGVFEVSYESLTSTTEALTNRGIAIDLVCLSPMPLHSVPLFKYREPNRPRPASGIADIQGGGYSPEMRQSFASLTNRTHFSPKSTVSSTPPASGPRGVWTPAHDWSYGIPHWLDISYWNPETYRESRRILKKDPNAPIPFTVTKKSKVFMPRVRMYEIQMGGVMESEQSNISIPYLSEGQGITRSLSSASLAPSRSSLRRNYGYKPPFSDSLRPGSFLEGHMGTPKEMLTKSQKVSMTANWMDDYDDNVFRPFSRRHQRRKHNRPKRPSEPEVQPNTHERLSARSVTHLREQEVNPNEWPRKEALPKSSASSSAAAKETTVTAASKAVSPRKPALKAASRPSAPRISRTISFALRGLGFAGPPRAQAMAEVNIAHATGEATAATKNGAGSLREAKSHESFNSASDAASTHTVVEASPNPNTPKASASSKPRSTQSSSPSLTPSRPIDINVPLKAPSEDSGQPARSVTGSYSSAQHPLNEKSGLGIKTKTAVPRFELTPSTGREQAGKNSQNRLLAPWVRSVNPCNLPREVSRDTSWFGRWQHAYPRPPHVAVVKWKSLKSPAILPLTTEEFPMKNELETDYLQTPYRVSPNDEEGIEAPKTTGLLMREMISLRLSHGFQIVVGKNVVEASPRHALVSPNVFDTQTLGQDGTTVYLSKGHSIHRLTCNGGTEVEVTRYLHRSLSDLAPEMKSGLDSMTMYSAAMRTIMSKEYDVKQINLRSSTEEYNWNYADNYVAGHRDHLFNPAQQLHFWRVRYVLIPVPLHVNSRHQTPINEDNEEEIHLLGINQLTLTWQRHKYVPLEEKRIEIKNRGPNPLNIIYQTRNPSEVVAAEPSLLTDPGLDSLPAPSLPESKLLERSKIDLTTLAGILQSDQGVKIMDRRWHKSFHPHCFVGNEFVTWLCQNFKDIDGREEAVKFGNKLRELELFHHVKGQHELKDGTYFYRFAEEHSVKQAVKRPGSRNSWFQIKSDKSVPSTPVADNWNSSPRSAHSRNASLEQAPPQTPVTPTKSKNKTTVLLSKTLKLDVDPRKRSNRPEVIDLHYDRVHNPDNCFHIELSWMNTTPKLIEDTVQSWAATAEKFGLKLVQVPIAEGCVIDQTQPFRRPYKVTLRIPPPKGPNSNLFNTASFSQQDAPDPHYFQKLILKKFDFVLDFEARSAFPSDVDVGYSWGRPDYKYPQYIHQSGCLLVQLTPEGEFLVLANRLVSTRTTPTSRDYHNRAEHHTHHRTREPIDRLAVSPRLSPAVRPIHDISGTTSPLSQSIFDSANLYRAPEYYLQGLEEFCNDPVRLGQLYSESFIYPPSAKAAPAAATPTTATASFIDSSIPSLELPGPVIGHHISPPPGTPSRPTTGAGGNTTGASGGLALSSVVGSGNLSFINPRARQRSESVVSRGSPRSGGLRPLNLSGA